MQGSSHYYEPNISNKIYVVCLIVTYLDKWETTVTYLQVDYIIMTAILSYN